MRRKTSKAGIELIKSHEGMRLEAYQCPAGVWTIGYGHTKDVKPKQIIDTRQAVELLKEDLKECEDVVNGCTKVPLNQNQFDALVSFVFNLGSGALKSSTLLKKLRQGDYEGAANEFTRWVFAGNKRLPGLVIRRQEEKELFLKSPLLKESI